MCVEATPRDARATDLGLVGVGTGNRRFEDIDRVIAGVDDIHILGRRVDRDTTRTILEGTAGRPVELGYVFVRDRRLRGGADEHKRAD